MDLFATTHDYRERDGGQPGLHNTHVHIPDARTTDEIEADADARTDSLREVLTGLPARPGVTR